MNEGFYNKMREYFGDNVRFSFKTSYSLYIITKQDIFKIININSANIPSFIINNKSLVIQSMIAKDLFNKKIIDIF